MKRTVSTTVTYILLTLVTLISVFPFYIILVMGTYKSADLFRGLPLWPSDFFMQNFRTAAENNLFVAYGNSLLVSVCSVGLAMFTSTGIGYAMAKFNFRLKKVFYVCILVGMMLPAQISVVGYMIEMRVLGLTGTYWSLLCTWVAHPFSAFFLSQFIHDSVPTEMLESARIDGCSEPGLLCRMVLPASSPLWRLWRRLSGCGRGTVTFCL